MTISCFFLGGPGLPPLLDELVALLFELLFFLFLLCLLLLLFLLLLLLGGHRLLDALLTLGCIRCTQIETTPACKLELELIELL